MSETIDITGIDKAALLAALYNNSQPMGMGWIQARPGDLTVEEAQIVLDERGDDVRAMFGTIAGRDRENSIYFDYLFGRPLKIEIGGDTLDPWLYDRDNGEGSAARIVGSLR